MRAPDPMRECRPGWTCRECNAVFWCADCGDVTVSDQGEVCAECSVEHVDSATDEQVGDQYRMEE